MPRLIGRRFRQLLIAHAAAERHLATDALRVVEIRTYPTGSNEWGHIGEVEVAYNRHGHRAVYGFDALARVQIYAD